MHAAVARAADRQGAGRTQGRDDGARGLRISAARRHDPAAAIPRSAFKDVDIALLVGARPRGPGMERKDLLLENAKIFTEQGKALDAVASRDVKVLVVGNPANTNAYIAMKSRAGLPQKNFTAMLRLDHNRALSQLAAQVGQAGRLDRQADRLGQPLADDVPGLSLRDRRRRIAEGADQRRELEPHGVPARPSASAAPRSSRRADCRRPPRPPTPRSTTCATGCSAATASG